MNLLWILLFASLCTLIKCVYIEKNGYQDVTISFSENILKETKFDFIKLKRILTKASNILFHATKKRSYYKDFVLVIPSTWTEDGICDEFTMKPPKNIDIYITGSSDISFITARHSKGCGKKGEIIYLPKEWMTGNEQDLALQFIQQWSTFRYGVYPENPERSGSCMASPDFTWSPTGCYNIDLEMEVQFDENGLPMCDLPIDFGEEEELNSSIMFSAANSSKILNFCDEENFPHNPIAPTLHNRICNGNSVWSVIESTEDFIRKRNSPMNNTNSPKTPMFRCFRESKSHLTIMIQETDSEARAEIRYALFYFLSVIEPADFTVSLATFSSNSTTDNKEFIDIDLQSTENLKSILESTVMLNEEIPDVCLTCGFRKAYTVSKISQNTTRTIILIARESSLQSMEISEIREIIQKDTNAVVYILFLEDTASDIISSSFVEIIQSTGGRIFRLKNEPVFMLSELTTALLGASKNVLRIEDKILVVHKKTYVNVTSDISDVFSTPKNIKGRLLYAMQFKKRGDIKSDTCTDMDKDLQSPICGNQVDMNDDEEAKIWRYPFRYVAGSKGTTCSSLALLKLESSSKNSFTLRGWLSDDKIIPGQNALVIYAEIYNRLNYDVKVEARISGPGLEEFQLELRDNGNGDPDVIKGDNIYSRYFTSFSEKGTYTVTITAGALASENSNVTVKEYSTINEIKVNQTKTIGTFKVILPPPKEDIFPPNRVCDLKIIRIDSSNKTVLLQWTAPGDNYDYGKANEYKIYLTEDWKNLEEGMMKKIPLRILNTSEMKPKMYGKKEREIFQLPKTPLSKIYFIALKAIDKNGNKGKISNILQVVMNNLAFHNLTQHNDTENKTDIVTNYHKDDTILNYTNMYIISGIVLSMIFLIIILNVLIWIFCFNKYKRKHQSTKVKDEYSDKRGNDINSDENILQSENENSQVKTLMENEESTQQNMSASNLMPMYATVQKRDKNQESISISYTNGNFKPHEIYHKENDLGFV